MCKWVALAIGCDRRAGPPCKPSFPHAAIGYCWKCAFLFLSWALFSPSTANRLSVWKWSKVGFHIQAYFFFIFIFFLLWIKFFRNLFLGSDSLKVSVFCIVAQWGSEGCWKSGPPQINHLSIVPLRQNSSALFILYFKSSITESGLDFHTCQILHSRETVNPSPPLPLTGPSVSLPQLRATSEGAPPWQAALHIAKCSCLTSCMWLLGG